MRAVTLNPNIRFAIQATARVLDRMGTGERAAVRASAQAAQWEDEYDDEYDDSFDAYGGGAADGVADAEGENMQVNEFLNLTRPEA